MAAVLPRIRIAAASPVFDLPVLVGLEAGWFKKAGLRVAYQQGGAADVFSHCAWGGVERDAAGVGRITALRPAIAAQAIVSFDDTLQNPHDLGGVEIGVNAHKASHYATLQLLAGSLKREQLQLRFAGAPEQRYRLLRLGRLRAATLMEPYLSLALKEGAHIVAMTFYRGADVMGADLSDAAIDAYYDVVNDAVDAINRDFSAYRPLIAAPLAGRLAPEEISRQFIRYAHAETFDEAHASKVQPWMSAWGLSAPHQSAALNKAIEAGSAPAAGLNSIHHIAAQKA